MDLISGITNKLIRKEVYEMATKKTALAFNTELSMTYGNRCTVFPDENSVGISLGLKDATKGRYEIRLHISETTSKKCGFHAQGKIIAQVSDCSSAMRVLFDDTGSPDFRGYSLRPVGGWQKEKAARKMLGVPMVFNSYVSIKAHQLNLVRTKIFKITYVPLLETKKRSIHC